MDTTIKAKVLDIISCQCGIKLEDIFLDARLESDYGVTGDDVWEIIEDLHTKLGVDFTDFEFDLYFHSEAESFFKELFNPRVKKHRKAFPVTIQHLIEVAEEKRWFKPPQVRKI
jgi:acyl carrier protein